MSLTLKFNLLYYININKIIKHMDQAQNNPAAPGEDKIKQDRQ